MATSTSFKQECPSCEAMVPIRDPGLIGRKIDCPKCKFRFVVAEPPDIEEEDEAPAPKKKGDTKITNKPADKGVAKAGAKGPSKTNPKKRLDGDEDAPKKKALGGSPVLLFGGLLALAAVVGIGITLYFMLSDDKKDANAGTKPPVTQPGGTDGDTPPAGPGGDTPPAGPVLGNVTNFLPNDTQVVISYPMDRTLASTLQVEGFDDRDGGFSAERFKANMGFAPDEVNRVITALNLQNDWVFTVLQTKKPYKADAMRTTLRLTAKEPVKAKSGKSYEVYQINGELDSLSNVLLKANKPRDQFQVHFLDANTLVFADPVAMKKFLDFDAKPEFLTKEVGTEAPPPATGGTPGGTPGMPGMPGGAPGIPGGSGAPPPVAPGGGAPTPGGAGGPMGGMPGAPGGMPGMPGGAPGGAPATPPPAEPVVATYMTLDPSLKNILDRLEVMKPNEKTKQKEIASVVTVALLVAPLKPMITAALDKQLVERRAFYKQLCGATATAQK